MEYQPPGLLLWYPVAHLASPPPAVSPNAALNPVIPTPRRSEQFLIKTHPPLPTLTVEETSLLWSL